MGKSHSSALIYYLQKVYALKGGSSSLICLVGWNKGYKEE